MQNHTNSVSLYKQQTSLLTIGPLDITFFSLAKLNAVVIILNLNACILMNFYTVESLRPDGTTLGKGGINSFEMALKRDQFNPF